MRQYRFDYGDIFKTGLVSNERARGFVRLQNLYPWDGELRYWDRPSVIEASDSTSQIFRIGLNSYRCGALGVERLVDGAYVFVVNLLSYASWSCLNYIKFGILTDGVNQVFVDSNGDCSLESEVILPKALSSCDLNGQAIVGGLDGTWNNLDSTFVAWSKIGKVDFTVDKSNEAGFHNPDIGVVKSVLQLAKDFVALGESGAAIYSPVVQTFGYRKIPCTGISSTLCATSNRTELYFVDKLGDLYNVEANRGFTNLGYRWLFKGKSIKLHWAESENELRIVVDNSKTFILNKYGMYETNLVILGSSIGGLCSVFGSQTVGDAYFETNDDDANVPGLKSVSEVYVNDSSLADKTISILATAGRKVNRSREQLVSHLGIVVPNITVDRYRIGYRVSNYLSGSISGLVTQTVKTDGRFGKGYQSSNMPIGG